jgi:hypothetical protein
VGTWSAMMMMDLFLLASKCARTPVHIMNAYVDRFFGDSQCAIRQAIASNDGRRYENGLSSIVGGTTHLCENSLPRRSPPTLNRTSRSTFP